MVELIGHRLESRCPFSDRALDRDGEPVSERRCLFPLPAGQHLAEAPQTHSSSLGRR